MLKRAVSESIIKITALPAMFWGLMIENILHLHF